jgi:hypothetical protein
MGFAVLALGMGLRAGRKRRLLDDTPLSKTLGVFVGEVELQGICVTTNPIRALFSKYQCVIYDWEIYEEWERWVTVTYTDNEGRRRTRREKRQGWEAIAGKNYWQGFYIKDEYGYVWVHPDGATLDRQLLFDEYTERGTALYAMGPRAEISDSTGRRRFKETGLAVGTSLFVRGRASERPDIVAPQIVQDERTEMFLISTRSEKAISQSEATAYFVWHVLGLMAGIFSGLVFGLNKVTSTGDNVPLYALCGGLIYGLAWLIGWIWMVFNSLIGLRNRVRQAQSLIDVQVKRRADLIPPLIACLQGLRQYEAEMQVAITQLRSQAGLLSGITEVSSTVMAVAEQYPVLMANQSFQSLSKNIKETEDRIALARNYANDITTFYNTRLTRIPDGYVAELIQMTPEPLFMANGFEQKVVPVGF